MWTYLVRVKMKDIGSDANSKKTIKVFKSYNKYLYVGKITKNYIDILSNDGDFDKSVYEKLSSIYKDKMIGINVTSAHNAYSIEPERFDNDDWNYYRNGREILCYKEKYNGKCAFYKVITNYIDYDNLVLETTVGQIKDICGTDKKVIKFFNIKNIKNKKEIVNVKYLDCKDQFDSFELDYLFGDIKGRKEKKITYDEFIEFFDKSEVSVFRKDLDSKETIKKNGKDKSK